jgi:two-component system nitrogen regulation response regulator GlnG
MLVLRGLAMPVLLAIDDEPSILLCYRLVFNEPDLSLETAASGVEGLDVLRRRRPDVVLLDVDLPDMSGLEVFQKIKEHDPRIPVIFITGSGSAQTAIQAMSDGAFEYVLKPLQLDRLRELVGRALEVSRYMRVPARLQEDERLASVEADVLVGRSPVMQEVYKAVGRVAPRDVPVLILGESGTGKELVARAIYHYSRRANGPFLAVNCAAIPSTLLESEFFGHERGAFTGADRRRIGKFEQCNGGTLFLDEIGDLELTTQAKLLRFLQDQTFQRVGGGETLRTDVRVIAATNRHLERCVAQGTFREDLYFRLNVFTLRLPPLRERLDDLPLLVAHFLKRFRRELHSDVEEISAEAFSLLEGYSWPGNVRELQGALKQAMVQATGPVLLPHFLPPSVRLGGMPSPTVVQKTPGSSTPAMDELDGLIQRHFDAGSKSLHAECLAWLEERLFRKVLSLTAHNLSEAARRLGIHRATLRSKLQSLRLANESEIELLSKKSPSSR